jgi:hypothetical protein
MVVLAGGGVVEAGEEAVKLAPDDGGRTKLRSTACAAATGPSGVDPTGALPGETPCTGARLSLAASPVVAENPPPTTVVAAAMR